MRKLVRDRKSASRRKSKNGRRLQTSLETFDEVDPCDVDEEEEEDEASQKVFGRSASWVSKGGLTLGRLLTLKPGDAFKTLAKFGDALRDNFGELHAQAKNEATWLSKDAFDSNRVRLTTRARANRIVRARRRRRRRANAKAVREEDGRHRWRLAVAQSTR